MGGRHACPPTNRRLVGLLTTHTSGLPRSTWPCCRRGCPQVPTCSGEFKQRMVQLLDDVREGRLHHPAPQRQQAGKQVRREPAAAAAGVVA